MTKFIATLMLAGAAVFGFNQAVLAHCGACGSDAAHAEKAEGAKKDADCAAKKAECATKKAKGDCGDKVCACGHKKGSAECAAACEAKKEAADSEASEG